MRRTLPLLLISMITIAMMATLVAAAPPVNTGFTYQGFLQEGGVPADGPYDIRFQLYDALTDGTQIGITYTLEDVFVTNGLFDVVVDFGSGVFDGQARWIEIHVREGSSGGAYTRLTPRRPLTAVPYAQYALNGTGGAGANVQTGQVTMDVAPGFVPETYSREVAFTPPFTANPAIAFGLQSASPLVTRIMPYAQDTTTSGFTLTVSIAPATPFTAPVSSAGGGTHASLAQVNGRPAVVYVNQDGFLTYVRAMNPVGTEWGTPVVVDPNNIAGFLSFSVVNDKPAVAYHNLSDNTIMYVRATDIDGAVWGTPVSIAGTLAEPGGNVSMAVVNGRPAIAFGSGNDRILSYGRANDPDGTSWGPVSSVDPYAGATHNSYGASLNVVSGLPAISYLQRNSGLRYISAGHPDGGFWQNPRDVYPRPTLFPLPAHRTSLVLVEGQPAVAATIDKELRYARATDVFGQDWGVSTLIEQLPAGSDSISYVSMEVVNGKPALAYAHQRTATADLKYAFSTDTAGREWELPVVLTTAEDPGTYSGRYASLENINGTPGISYQVFSSASGNGIVRYISILVRETPTFKVDWTATLP